MVVIFVAATFLIFVIAGVLAGKKSRASQRRPAIPHQTPVSIKLEHTDRFFHPAHTWAQVQKENLIEVGADDFLSRFLGPVEKVGLPKKNSILHQGSPMAALRRGNRTITLLAPVSGVLADVNDDLLKHPQLVNDSPYESGWIARIIPFDLKIEMRNLLKDFVANRWLEAHRLQLINSFAPKVGTVVQDGGQLVQDIGRLLSDEEWHRLGQEFFPIISIRQLPLTKPEEGKSL